MGLDGFFETIAQGGAAATDVLDQWARTLPVSLAFAAGMLAAVNPCGFIMLPAFSAFYVSDEGTAGGRVPHRLGRAASMSFIVTGAFVVTFGTAGIAATLAGRAVIEWSAWAGLLAGAALVGLGVTQLVGRRSYLAGATSRLRMRRSRSVGGVAAFGLAYAVVSLGCTLPVFVAVVGLSLTGGSDILAAGLRYVEYSAGMGAVLLAVALGTALARAPVTAFAHRAGGVVDASANVVLVIVGAYVVWYWGGVV